jgi:dTDP-4-amino-4,6-dideoxygalactose transaminase
MSVTVNKVPFVDLKAQYASIKDEIDSAVARVIDRTSFILGEEVAAFEAEFAEFSGFRHVVAVGNGTDAIELALRGAGLAEGDEVVAPTHTFVASTEAVTRAGGHVRLADVDRESFCMSDETLERALTERTRFALPVPIYGNPAGLDRVAARARERGVRVIADCAQAHGARLGGRPLGELVDTATFSFYPGKNLGAYGDAGAVATNDDDVARSVRMWRNHGREGKFDHRFEGVNSRMDGIQGAILRAKLPHLSAWTASRRRVASLYGEALADLPGVELPRVAGDAEHVFHLYVVRLDDRDEVRQRLRDRGVASGVHYPLPVHRYPAYAHLGHGPGSFPVAEGICERIISLPMYPEMGPAEVGHVASALRESLRARGS